MSISIPISIYLSVSIFISISISIYMCVYVWSYIHNNMLSYMSMWQDIIYIYLHTYMWYLIDI